MIVPRSFERFFRPGPAFKAKGVELGRLHGFMNKQPKSGAAGAGVGVNPARAHQRKAVPS